MNLAKKLKHPIFKTISQVAENEQLETYVVGGYVRVYYSIVRQQTLTLFV